MNLVLQMQPLLGNRVLRLRLLCADRVSNTTDTTLALVPEDYEVKPGRAGRCFAGPTFGYEWSEVDCEFMNEVIIDIDKELAILGEPQGRPRTLGAGSVFSWLFHQLPQTSPALIIVDVGHHLCSQLCILLTLCRE
jgi:hypothetical protein